MRRIGHRGARGHAPENTIAGFEAAVALGCDEVETDVWLVGDSLVIQHDPPLSAEGLLTLDDVLDVCRGRLAVNVEVKSAVSEAHARESGARVARRIASRSDIDAFVSSFWWPALEGARGAAPRVRRAFIYAASPRLASLLGEARLLGLWALHPALPYVTEELVTAAHASSLRVNVWTVNEPDDIERLGTWDVDGIVSDYPERVPKL